MTLPQRQNGLRLSELRPMELRLAELRATVSTAALKIHKVLVINSFSKARDLFDIL